MMAASAGYWAWLKIEYYFAFENIAILFSGLCRDGIASIRLDIIGSVSIADADETRRHSRHDKQC